MSGAQREANSASCENIPEPNVVVSRHHACAVGYCGVNTDQEVGAVLHVYTRNGDALQSRAEIAMYKAHTSIAEDYPGYSLIIRADYGRDEPVVVRLDDLDQLRELLALTHAEGVFCLVKPPTLQKRPP
jgi:hypothetical protein